MEDKQVDRTVLEPTFEELEAKIAPDGGGGTAIRLNHNETLIEDNA